MRHVPDDSFEIVSDFRIQSLPGLFKSRSAWRKARSQYP
jgi:hypothetical protein